MTLQGLLAELRDNILRDVSDSVSSGEEDLLWSSDSLVNYINNGYFKFARETRIIEDDETEEITRITLDDDVDRYKLDSRVLYIKGVFLDGEWLSRQRHETMARPRSGVVGSASTRPSTYGRLFAFSTDRRMQFMQLYDPPREDDAGKELELTVTRLPLESLSYKKPKEVPEIPEDYHLDLLEWAAYRALRNHDTDGENVRKAERHRQAFFDAVSSARRESSRMSNSPVQFGATGTRWF